MLALLVGLPLMRLSGLAAGIATFAVLEITHNLLREWTKIGPGATTLSLVPETTGALQATLGALRRRRRRVRVPAQPPRPAGPRVARGSRRGAGGRRRAFTRQRLWAFTLSGVLARLRRRALVHLLGSITTEQVYLELTFVTLAMLVVGGLTSLWGAVLGALAVSGLDSFLGEAEQGRSASPRPADGDAARRRGRAHGAVLILRPSGLTGGREFSLPPEAGDEGLRRRLRRGRLAVRGEPRARSTTSRCGPTTSPRSTSRRSTSMGCGCRRGRGARERLRATTDASELPPCDFGIVATKAMHTEAAIAATAHAFRGRRRRVRPERHRQRGGDRRARRARDPRHDLPGRPDPRARPRPVGRQGRHDLRALRAEPGARRGDRAARRRVHARAGCRRRRSPTRAARSGAR